MAAINNFGFGDPVEGENDTTLALKVENNRGNAFGVDAAQDEVDFAEYTGMHTDGELDEEQKPQSEIKMIGFQE